MTRLQIAACVAAVLGLVGLIANETNTLAIAWAIAMICYVHAAKGPHGQPK